MKAQKTKPGKGQPMSLQGKGKAQPKMVVMAESSDDDEPSDDEDMDEDMDDIDEDVSLDEESQGSDEEEGSDEEDSDEDVIKVTKKAVAKKDKEVKEKEQQPIEDRSKAVGPLTEAEGKIFTTNFRAMSATSIFVAKIPEDATEDDLKKLHHSVRSIRRPVTRKGKPTTFAFLNFADKEAAKKALTEINKNSPVKIRGQVVMVSENGSGQCHPPALVDRRKLKIYGCPRHVTKETVMKVLPGCVDVLLSERDRGSVLEAVAIFPSSAAAKKAMDAHPTITLREVICALFYLNVSHSTKQHERKKERKAALKKEIKERKARAAALATTDGGDDDDDDDESEDSDSENVVTPAKKQKKENVKPNGSASAKQGKKRPAPSSDDDDDDDDDEEEVETPKGKKVSMKTPQKTPGKADQQKKTPRKGTPFKAGGGVKQSAKKQKAK